MPVHQEVRWQDPPPPRSGRTGLFSAVLAELRSHIGEWGIVAEYKSPDTAATTARRLRGRGVGRELRLDVTTRQLDSGVCAVYARVVRAAREAA